ncbi:MAG: hypothetical protein RL696_222 [Actinomycetota bacterium]
MTLAATGVETYKCRTLMFNQTFDASVSASATSMTALSMKWDNAPVVFPITLIFTGILGWIASFGLTLERIHVAANPEAATACDISPFISCKSVMLSEQAALFGFPNPLIGIAAFFAPVVVGFAILAGAQFKPWFWNLFLGGVTLAMVFVHWLFLQSVYDIGSLCLYCMVAWTATIPLFWVSLSHNLKEGYLTTRFMSAGQVMYEWSWVLALLNYLVLIGLILVHFWDFWPTLF